MSKLESKFYAKFGASSSKEAVHSVVGNTSDYFCKLIDDVCGDPDYYSLVHADGAGTKSIIAYLAYKETGDLKYFAGIAQDSLVMNIDDIACVNAFESLAFSNSIGRNKNIIPDEAIKVIINSYDDVIENLRDLGVDIKSCGGETADLGDLVRTIILDSTIFGRVKSTDVISTSNMQPGDVIVGLSSTGQASFENTPNSGIASNGISLARHALISKEYLSKYPEIIDPKITDGYQGKFDIFKTEIEPGMTIIDGLLSPTRSYSPIIKKICQELGSNVHGIIHLTGGAQTKILKFGSNLKFVKNNLFPMPKIFRLIQESLSVPWDEIYTVFNSGHRIEVVLPKEYAQRVIEITNEFNIDAQIIGHLEYSEKNALEISGEFGTFNF